MYIFNPVLAPFFSVLSSQPPLLTRSFCNEGNVLCYLTQDPLAMCGCRALETWLASRTENWVFNFLLITNLVFIITVTLIRLNLNSHMCLEAMVSSSTVPELFPTESWNMGALRLPEELRLRQAEQRYTSPKTARNSKLKKLKLFLKTAREPYCSTIFWSFLWSAPNVRCERRKSKEESPPKFCNRSSRPNRERGFVPFYTRDHQHTPSGWNGAAKWSKRLPGIEIIFNSQRPSSWKATKPSEGEIAWMRCPVGILALSHRFLLFGEQVQTP